MKNLLFVVFAVVATSSSFAQHSLEKIWETDSVLKSPESALYVARSKILYVSNIGDFKKEGVGFISIVGLDGKIIKRDWVTGLTAPKGLGIFSNLLYAAEPTTVAVIDIKKARVVGRIPVKGAQFLNDITIDSKGIVYVSDTRTNKVHKIQNGKAAVYLENMKSANGLLAVGNDLYVLTDSILQKADAHKNLITLVRGLEGGADGIEMIAPHQFIITGWAGTIYFAKDDGYKQTLVDKRSEGLNAADLGYNPTTKTVYIPAMLKNKLVAYTLK
ncbi:MAG: hypothetical protein NVS1B13_09200 [Flavisolibacter sp.]